MRMAANVSPAPASTLTNNSQVNMLPAKPRTDGMPLVPSSHVGKACLATTSRITDFPDKNISGTIRIRSGAPAQARGADFTQAELNNS